MLGNYIKLYRRRRKTVKILHVSIVLVMILLFTSLTQAVPLSLVQQPPDFTSGFIDVTYTAGGGANNFQASGYTFALDLDGIAPPDHAVAGGLISILATVDTSGNASGGTLLISGTIAGLGFNSGTLLTGTLLDFGFTNSANSPLEFLWVVTGGDAASLFGTRAGTIMAGSGFPGQWAVSFDNLIQGQPETGMATTDTFKQREETPAVPEPMTALMSLLSLGGAAMAASRRRR